MTSLSDGDAMKADMDFSFCDDPLLFDKDDCFCLLSLFDDPFDLPLP